jgi:hypothetical protein
MRPSTTVIATDKAIAQIVALIHIIIAHVNRYPPHNRVATCQRLLLKGRLREKPYV